MNIIKEVMLSQALPLIIYSIIVFFFIRQEIITDNDKSNPMIKVIIEL